MSGSRFAEWPDTIDTTQRCYFDPTDDYSVLNLYAASEAIFASLIIFESFGGLRLIDFPVLGGWIPQESSN